MEAFDLTKQKLDEKMREVMLLHSYFENTFGYLEHSDRADDALAAVRALEGDGLVEEIYTWRIGDEETEAPVDIVFDLRFLSFHIDHASRHTGLDEPIQRALAQHPQFASLMKRVRDEVRESGAHRIAFRCRHGKHRSVGFAELARTLLWPSAVVRHRRINLP